MADLETVRSQALQLEPDARATLVDALLESLDVSSSSEAATSVWFAEVQSRRRAVTNGSDDLLPGDDLFAGIDDGG